VTLEPVTEVPFHGGGADVLALAYPAAINAVQVLPEHGFAEWLGGMLARQDARQPLPELPPALQTLPLSCRQLQPAVAQPQVLVAHQPAIPTLASLPLAVTMRAGFRSGIPNRNPHLPTLYRNPGNLVPGQA